MYTRHFLSFFLAITIDQPKPKFHCVKQLYTCTVHPNLAYCSQSTPLPLEYQLSIWLEGLGAYRAGNAWAPLDVKKVVLIFTVKNMLKFENFWKCTPEMYLFRLLNTPLGGGGAATQTFAPGGKYPRAATDRIVYSIYGNVGLLLLLFLTGGSKTE